MEPITPTGNKATDATLTSVARFVEDLRGHPFRSPVHVELVSDAAFRRAVAAGFDASAEELQKQGQILKLMGLIPENADFVAISRKYTTEEVIGFYDPQTKRLVVRSAALTPFAQVTLAHELTHALDDQWFGLYRPLVERDDEASFAFTALIEGSAERVRRAFLQSMTRSERAQAAQEADEFGASIDTSGIPTSVIELAESPYTLGAVFVDDLVTKGGIPALDAAFRDPPATSEQVMHPEKYESHEAAIPVAVPPAEGSIVDEGQFGELFIMEFLNVALEPARARRAAEGWGGDRYVMWRDTNGSTCVRDDIATDTPDDKQELQSALHSWQFGRDQGTITEVPPRNLRLTVCN